MSLDAYRRQIEGQLESVAATQREAIGKAAERVADAMAQGGRLAVLGFGHAVIPVLEVFCRGGGLVPVLPVFAPGMMLWDWPVRRGFAMEHEVPGYAPLLLDGAGVDAKDVLLIVSTAGVIPIAVEAARAAGNRGIPTIALTSVAWARELAPLHPSGKRVHEVVDVVLDNCGGPGYGAATEVAPGMLGGPTASIADLFLINALLLEVTRLLRERGHEPPLLRSNSEPGGREHNARLLNHYRDALPWA